MGIEKRIAEIANRKLEIRNLLESDQAIELEKIEAELRELETEEKELRARLEKAKNIQTGEVKGRVIASTADDSEKNKFESMEYRRAFMDYVTRGVKSDILEFRADATTGVADIGAVIPTTILDRIVEKMDEYGQIWARVSKTSMQGGVEIPISSAKPTATWVTAGTMSDKQKKTVSANISFSYHKLQCRVAVELVAGTVALPVFEATVSNNIYEAMVKALEQAIISGTGTGEPLGIATDPDIPVAQIVEIASADIANFGKYDTWTELLAKMPRSYRRGAVIIMNDADWNKYIVGMVDSAGQPIARVTFGLDGTQQERFLGKEVIPTEEYLPSIDDATAGEVVAIICRLSDYLVNSNMQLTYRRYFDESTDEWISKATMICDGKLADKNGVVLIKKGD